jgi:prolyl-tRNA editing enzyme YbaK/EbsC (Cys-tRNA(Pro) deacylase)
LLAFDHVWAAAGAHDAVFAAEPKALLEAAKAQVADLAVHAEQPEGQDA